MNTSTSAIINYLQQQHQNSNNDNLSVEMVQGILGMFRKVNKLDIKSNPAAIDICLFHILPSCNPDQLNEIKFSGGFVDEAVSLESFVAYILGDRVNS